ncbi:uncharacterized protein [Palaemon carinicauda]|uniref:uncharacterized protein n=1 Tax=Palaemon carinicauda TaxID=392227 RepID=UPI0035B606A4
MHGHFLGQSEEFASKKTWQWLRREELKKETEGMNMATQDQALMNKIGYIPPATDGNNISSKKVPQWLFQGEKVEQVRKLRVCKIMKEPYQFDVDEWWHLDRVGIAPSEQYTVREAEAVQKVLQSVVIKPEGCQGMNKLTIPKLELLALLLGSRLAKTLKELIEPREIVIWTHSKVTLAWVASPEAKDHKNVFISNRVAEIVFLQQVCRFSLIRVPSKQNPADILSRCATTQQLLDNSLWRTSPEFLRTTGKPVPCKEQDPTQEKTTVAAVQELREEMNPAPTGEIWEILQREVEFQFLLRVVEKCWVAGLCSIAKRTLRQSSECVKAFQPLMKQPPPPPLPKERITLTKPFTAVGVDHTAVIQTETRPGYILIVTCIASRAVYLDFCPSLEAEEFLLALKRFSATHGVLQGLYEEDEVQQFLRKTGIKWRFQTPRAPWKGGFFKRLIGVTKRTLQIALGKKYLPDAHILTLVKEAEAVVNDRLLMYSGNKCEDEVLTPSHLLRGHPVHLMAPILPDDHLNATFTSQRLRDRYLKLTDSLKAFRERWRREYLSALRARHDCRSSHYWCLHVATKLDSETMLNLSEYSISRGILNSYLD